MDLLAAGPSNDTVRVSAGSRASSAALSVTSWRPSMTTTGLPAEGAVSVAGAVAIPTVTCDTRGTGLAAQK